MRKFSSSKKLWGKILFWSPLIWLSISVILCFGLFIGALKISSSGADNQRFVVRVYCASAVVDPMKKIVEQFNSSRLATSNNIAVRIVRSGGSGALAGQISSEAQTGVKYMADVFVSSDSNRIMQLVEENVIEEHFPVAAQFPVIAIRHDWDSNLHQTENLKSLVNLEVKFGVGSVSSAIGFETDRIANLEGCGELLQTSKTAEFENVMSLAQALSLGSIDAAIVWDCTVFQFNQTGSQPIKVSAYLNSGSNSSGNYPDKVSLNDSTCSVQSKCFVEVGRSQSDSHHADLFFNYLKINRYKLVDNFTDAGFSSYLSEPSAR